MNSNIQSAYRNSNVGHIKAKYITSNCGQHILDKNHKYGNINETMETVKPG